MNDIKYFLKYLAFKALYVFSYIFLLPSLAASYLAVKITFNMDRKSAEYYRKWKNQPEDLWD